MSGGPVLDALTGMVFGLTVATRGERYALGGLASPIIGFDAILADIIKKNQDLQLTGDISLAMDWQPRWGQSDGDQAAIIPTFFRVPEVTRVFVGRTSDLDSAIGRLGSGDDALAVIALNGLGGVGKTELAAQLCHTQRAKYRFVWWFTAADRAALLDEYTSLAASLGIQRLGVDAEVTAVHVREWLERARGRWLVVFDNADDPRVLTGFVPFEGTGDVIVTSRYADWDRSRFLSYKMVPLSASDGAELLMARTGQQDSNAAKVLAEQLGGLALALQQASAFMARSGWSSTQFSDRLKERSRDLLKIGPDRSFSGNYAFSVYTVWEQSIDQSVAQAPYAREVLQVLALLAAERIPRGLFMLGDPSVAEGDDLAIESALLALADYSLIDLAAHTVSLHRLVQEVELANMRDDGESLRMRAVAASNLLLQMMPSDPDDCDSWDRCAEIVPHVLNISGLLDPLAYPLDAVARVESLAGSYLNSRGSRQEAQLLLQRAVSRVAGAGADSAATLVEAELNLARVERNLGDLTGALTHAKESHQIAQTLTSVEPRIASLSILGRVLMDSGDTAGAEDAYNAALDLVRDGSWSQSRLAVAVLNHTGRARMRRSANQEALELLLKAAEIDQSLHQQPHADTAWTLDNLGMAKFALGDIDGAELDLRRALEIESTIHGADHPRSAWSFRNLSRVLMARGDALTARSLLLRSLAIIDSATPNNRSELLATARVLHDVCNSLADDQGSRFATGRIEQLTETV